VSFGTKLREYRKRSGMKQNILAGRVGIHPEYLGDIERGRYTNPGVIIVARLIKELHLDTNEAAALMEEFLR